MSPVDTKHHYYYYYYYYQGRIHDLGRVRGSSQRPGVQNPWMVSAEADDLLLITLQ